VCDTTISRYPRHSATGASSYTLWRLRTKNHKRLRTPVEQPCSAPSNTNSTTRTHPHRCGLIGWHSLVYVPLTISLSCWHLISILRGGPFQFAIRCSTVPPILIVVAFEFSNDTLDFVATRHLEVFLRMVEHPSTIVEVIETRYSLAVLNAKCNTEVCVLISKIYLLTCFLMYY
jgi:hypothetical protein